MNPMTKWVVIGVVVVVLVLLLMRRGSGTSTGTIQTVGPTATDAEIASARYNAASGVFSSLLANNAATQQEQIRSQASIDIANVTAPAYTQAAEAQAAAAQAIAGIEAQAGVQETALATRAGRTQAQAQAGQGWLDAIGKFFGSLFGGIFGGGGGAPAGGGGLGGGFGGGFGGGTAPIFVPPSGGGTVQV